MRLFHWQAWDYTKNHHFPVTVGPELLHLLQSFTKFQCFFVLWSNFSRLQLSTVVRLRLAPYRPSTAALSLLWEACWTGPPPPPGCSSSTAGTRRALPEDTPDGSLAAPAESTPSVPQNVTAESASSCSPDSEYEVSYTGRALGATSQSCLRSQQNTAGSGGSPHLGGCWSDCCGSGLRSATCGRRKAGWGSSLSCSYSNRAFPSWWVFQSEWGYRQSGCTRASGTRGGAGAGSWWSPL